MLSPHRPPRLQRKTFSIRAHKSPEILRRRFRLCADSYYHDLHSHHLLEPCQQVKKNEYLTCLTTELFDARSFGKGLMPQQYRLSLADVKENARTVLDNVEGTRIPRAPGRSKEGHRPMHSRTRSELLSGIKKRV